MVITQLNRFISVAQVLYFTEAAERNKIIMREPAASSPVILSEAKDLKLLRGCGTTVVRFFTCRMLSSRFETPPARDFESKSHFETPSARDFESKSHFETPSARDFERFRMTVLQHSARLCIAMTKPGIPKAISNVFKSVCFHLYIRTYRYTQGTIVIPVALPP